MPPRDEESPSTDASPDPVQLERLRDDVRTAAQQDAAEIVARARRDIRRVVTDARRELLELSAQLQAVNVALPDAALPDPSVIADEELPFPAALTASSVTAVPPQFDIASQVESAGEVVSTRESGGVSEPASEPGPAFGLESDAPSSRGWIPIAAAAAVLLVVAIGWLSRRGTSDPGTPSSQASAAPSPVATSPATPNATGAGSPSADAAGSAATAGRITLDLSWLRSTWVRTTVDGTADAGRIYEAGTTRHIEAAEAVTLRAGDAGAVLVGLNGASAAPLGADGTPLTREFARPAVARPPAAAPATTTPAAAAPASAPASAASAAPAASAPVPARAPAGTGAGQTPAVPPSAAPAVATAPSDTTAPARPAPGRVDLTVSGQQWLDAYHRQDRPAMESVGGPGAIVSDDRRPEQRFPFGLDVARRFEDVSLNLAGDTAVYTSRMVERATTGEHASRVTQTWVRRMGIWRLQDSRISADAALPRP